MDPRPPYRLLTPGPVPVPPDVLAAMSGKVLHHRTPEFERILLAAWSGLKYVFQTRQPVQILTGTGSAAMEAAIVNLLSPGDQVLCVVSGKFGERWAEICERFGVKTFRWNLKWGEAAALEAFEAQLKTHSQIRAVFTQVCETSTATVHPIHEMARAVRRITPQALFAVDAITAVGCMPLLMDEWELDVVIGGSQKAFMIPTGLGFIALSERAWMAQSQSRLPKFYLDLASERRANEKKETHFSTPTPLITGLRLVVERIQEVGLSQVIARASQLAECTRFMGEKLALPVFSRAPSSSVTALSVPDTVTSTDLRDWMERECHITIMGGQDQLKGKIVRVGHMGDIRDNDMLALGEALAAGMDKFTGSQHLAHVWPELRRELASRLGSVAPLFP
ncbi:MAG: alanine--glyoxylate aminotransferase family protein [Bdellovibrionales bacterium]